jgi:hypothetical protein
MSLNRLILPTCFTCLIALLPPAGSCLAAVHELVGAIEAESTKFRPVTREDVARSKETVHERLLGLTAVFGDNQNWREYLLWDEQLTEFEAEGADAADLWRRVYYRVARDADLFEREQFQAYRDALRHLIHVIESHEDTDLEQKYQAVLTELLEIVKRSGDTFSGPDAIRVSELLTRLDRQQQAPGLIHLIRKHANQPNVLVEIPSSLLDAEQPIKEDYSFRRNIRGSYVEGNGTMNARQEFAFGSSAEAVILKSTVRGTSNSRSLGYGNRVTVRSASSLTFESSAQVQVDLTGIHHAGFNATGNLSTQILGIATSYNRRAASRARQAVYARQEADRRASEAQALSDIESAFNVRLDEVIGPLQESYLRDCYLPLTRHDRLPGRSKFSSGARQANIQVWVADESQLAASSGPEWPHDSPGCFRLAIHESALNNTAALLAGRIRTLASVLEGHIFEHVGETAKPSERLDIRFAEEAPLRLSFRDEMLELRLAGSEFITDGSRYPGLEITLRYRLDASNAGVLRQVEPPRVSVVEPGNGNDRPRLGIRGIALRRILANVLAEHAVEDLNLDDVILPEQLGLLGDLKTQRIEIANGWLTVAAKPAP